MVDASDTDSWSGSSARRPTPPENVPPKHLGPAYVQAASKAIVTKGNGKGKKRAMNPLFTSKCALGEQPTKRPRGRRRLSDKYPRGFAALRGEFIQTLHTMRISAVDMEMIYNTWHDLVKVHNGRGCPGGAFPSPLRPPARGARPRGPPPARKRAWYERRGNMKS